MISFNLLISIHAPSRERRYSPAPIASSCNFNPRSLAGATNPGRRIYDRRLHFNPRSLAGATKIISAIGRPRGISIHAPSRERHSCAYVARYIMKFQSTLPRGSDTITAVLTVFALISIHAPSRERRLTTSVRVFLSAHFNPRSLAGATPRAV